MLLINKDILLSAFEFGFICSHRELERNVFCGLLL